MKIVTIWSTYGPYHLARVKALELVFLGSDVVCFSHCAGSSVYEFFNLQPRKHTVLVRKDSSRLRFSESLFATLRALWRERPDLILTCGYERPESLASVIWARIMGHTVFLMLDNQHDDHYRHSITEFAKRLYLRFFDGFVYGGDTYKDYLRRLGVPPNREVHGYNCVDNQAIWQEVLAARLTGQRACASEDYFLCVARMIPKKNLVRLVFAYASYVQRVGHDARPWMLVICGDGPERAHVGQAIRDCDVIEKVILTGQVDAFDQIVNYYAFARALVLASHENEQWGLVVNEAMASGLPVVVSRQCGCATSLVKNGQNGFSFDGESVGELTELLLWMHQHSDQLTRMGERSREIIAEYSPQNFARNIMSLLASREKCD